MNKLWSIVLMILMILPLCYATEIGVLGQNTTLWSWTNITNQTASITIYYPNGTMAQTGSMTNVTSLLFNYYYTPTITGDYHYTTTFSNGISQTGTQDQNFNVQEDSEMYLSIILGIIAAMTFFFIIGFYLIKGKINKPEEKGLKLQDLGMFFILLDFVLLIALFGFLQNFAQGQSFSTEMDAVYGIGVWVTILCAALYIIAYTIYRVTVRIGALQQKRQFVKR